MSNPVPEAHDAPRLIQHTKFGPVDPADPPGLWRQFLNFLRARIGLKPLELVERYAEAKVRKEEIDNQTKLLKAMEDYERTTAEVRRMDRESAGKEALDKATAKKVNAEARKTAAEARIKEWAARQLEARAEGPERAIERLQAIIRQIEVIHGGKVEFDLLEVVQQIAKLQEPSEPKLLLPDIPPTGDAALP